MTMTTAATPSTSTAKVPPPPPPPPPPYPTHHKVVTEINPTPTLSQNSLPVWQLQDDALTPTLDHAVALANHLAAQSVDDRVMRFRFAASTTDEELTLHRSRLLFAGGPLAALVRRPFTELNHGLVTLCPDDHPSTFAHLRRFLYGLPIPLSPLPLPAVMALALSAHRWQLHALFRPTLAYIETREIAEADDLLPAAPLLTLRETPSSFRTHIRNELARFLSNALNTSFPNPPTGAASRVLRCFHDLHFLAPALAVASQRAPLLPLAHGILSGLDVASDSDLAFYCAALPIASAGVTRLLACDAATARWSARGIRVATAAATTVGRLVSRTTLPLPFSSSASVRVGNVRVAVECIAAGASRGGGSGGGSAGVGSGGGGGGGGGVEVRVHASTLGEGGMTPRDPEWTFIRVRTKGVPCGCGNVYVVEDAGEVIVRLGDSDGVKSGGGLAFGATGIDRWRREHVDCELVFGVEVELLRGPDAVTFGSAEKSGTGRVERAENVERREDSKGGGEKQYLGREKDKDKDKNRKEDRADGMEHDPGVGAVDKEAESRGTTGAQWVIGV